MRNKLKKTKFMTLSGMPYDENVYGKLGTHNFKTVNDHIYLGTILTNKN
jgi:hypothetical protein